MFDSIFNGSRWMSCLRIAAAAAACAALTACGQRDARFNPSHFKISGAAAPPEVVLPANVKPGTRMYGITTTAPDYENLCCAAQARVDAPVRKEVFAARLRIGLYVPKGTVQHLRVTFPNGAVESRDIVKPGVQLVSVPVPQALRARRGIVPIRIDAAKAPYVLISLYFV